MVDCSVGGGEVPLLDVNKVFMTFLGKQCIFSISLFLG